jgi:hypothetical protein
LYGSIDKLLTTRLECFQLLTGVPYALLLEWPRTELWSNHLGRPRYHWGAWRPRSPGIEERLSRPFRHHLGFTSLLNGIVRTKQSG